MFAFPIHLPLTVMIVIFSCMWCSCKQCLQKISYGNTVTYLIVTNHLSDCKTRSTFHKENLHHFWALKLQVWAQVEQPWEQILVVVANILIKKQHHHYCSLNIYCTLCKCQISYVYSHLKRLRYIVTWLQIITDSHLNIWQIINFDIFQLCRFVKYHQD